MDSRGPPALETDWNNEGDGGESAGDGALPPHHPGREGVRAEVPAVDSDARYVHDVGNRAADPILPGEVAGFGADVRLRRPPRRGSGAFPAAGFRAAASVPVLLGLAQPGYRLPRLVVLGLVMSFPFSVN